MRQNELRRCQGPLCPDEDNELFCVVCGAREYPDDKGFRLKEGDLNPVMYFV